MKPSYRYLLFFSALLLLVFISSNPAYATKWNVNPGMSREFIQAIIDTAKDGDVIYFNPGTYDFSAAPANWNYEDGGALKIQDKSLTIKGAPGATLLGSPNVEIEGNRSKGTTCFWVLNPKANKDVTFNGLTIQTFRWGILTDYSNGDPDNPLSYPNLRNLTVRNCTFTDIKRHGIITSGVQGDITIANNTINGDIASSGYGMLLDWWSSPGHMDFQPKRSLVTINNNSIRNFGYGILFTSASNVLVKYNNISTDISPNYKSVGISFEGLKTAATVANNVLSNLAEGVDIWGGTWPITSENQYPATRITVKYNNLSNIWYSGIWVYGDLAYSNSIIYNTIETLSSDESIAIYSEGFNNEFNKNILKGFGGTAVCLSGHTAKPHLGLETWAHNEFFKNNSIAGFSDPLHYWLRPNTHDNTIIGLQTENARYIDEGYNNIFKFVYPLSSSTGTTTLMSFDLLKARKVPQKRTQTK